MEQSYPKYLRYELKNIFDALPHSERTTIKQFIAYCAISAGERKQGDVMRSIVQFRHIVQRDLSKITIQDLRRFLAILNQSDRREYTKNGIKAHIRRFLKWRFKDWSQRFEEFRDIKLKRAFNEQRINEGTLLKTEQIEAIVKKEPDFVRKAFFTTLYESGMRPQELRLLQWKHVHVDGDQGLSQIHVFATKTSRARTVFVKEATFYLKRLFENRESEYVFPSPENKNEPLPKSTSFRWIQEMGKAVHIHMFPYLLRHTRAHELYSRMPSKVAQRFMGHGSDMSDLYAHISSKDIKESMLKTVYNFEELPEDTKHKLEIQVDALQKEIDVIRKHFPEIARVLRKKPSVEKVNAVLEKRKRLPQKS